LSCASPGELKFFRRKTSIKINLKAEYLDIFSAGNSINYHQNPLQILMYKFVYTTMTSHEYFLLSSWALEKRAREKKANNNKPKNEFKDHDDSKRIPTQFIW
jgi:hypothetical protein